MKCELCGYSSRHLHQPLCKYCERLAEPMRELWEFVNDEIGELDSVTAETSEVVRFIADLAALGVDHMWVKHVARTCSILIGLVTKYGGMGSIIQLEKRIGTLRDLDRILDFMARQRLIERDESIIKIPEDSLVRKVAIPLRARPGRWFAERASLFLFGYMMLAAFNEFYEDGGLESLKDLFATRSNSITRPASFMMALFFILCVWHDGFKQFSDSWLRAYLGRSHISIHLIEEVRAKLTGEDPKISVSFVRTWKGRYDLHYVFDDYVLRIRERLRERERERVRETH